MPLLEEILLLIALDDRHIDRPGRRVGLALRLDQRIAKLSQTAPIELIGLHRPIDRIGDLFG